MLQGRTGATMILATHDADVANACETVVRLVDGKVESIEPRT